MGPEVVAIDNRRTWKREELLAATEKNLEKTEMAVLRQKNPLRGKDKIVLCVGKWIDRHYAGNHFELTFEDDRFTWSRNEEKIRKEAALDGLYVIRTSLLQDFTILTPLFHDVDPSSIKTHQIP